MSQRSFTPGAARLAGMAGALLGWRPEEFWTATPAELEMIFQTLMGSSEEVVTATSADLARLKERFPDG